jgi:hypothetical protein
MLALTIKWATSRLKKISPRVVRIFYRLNHLPTMASRLKKIFPRLTYIFFMIERYQLNIGQSVQVNHYLIDLKKIYTSYVFLLKAKAEFTDRLAIKKLVVVGNIFS